MVKGNAAGTLTVIAWTIFVGGLGILITSDALIRHRAGEFGHSGLPTPDVIWFGVPILLAMLAIVVLWRSTIGFRHLWLRFIVVAAQMFVGFVLYMMIMLWYVIGTGIDAM
jgi:hypothetical protein